VTSTSINKHERKAMAWKSAAHHLACMMINEQPFILAADGSIACLFKRAGIISAAPQRRGVAKSVSCIC